MRLLLTIILLLCTTSCIKTDSNVVDQQYINSPQYQQFNEQVSTEIRTRQALEAPLQSHLQQMICCNPNHRFSYPITFNEVIVDNILDGDNVNCYKEISVGSVKLKLIILGSSTFGDVHLRWILLDGETAYRNQELVVGTYLDQELKNFRTIGVVKENISEKIISDVRVHRMDHHIRISSETDRHILYPIEQHYKLSEWFEITLHGGIKNGG